MMYAIQHLVDKTPTARLNTKEMEVWEPFALALIITLVAHLQDVDQNALETQTAHQINIAKTIGAVTHALTDVEKVLIATSEIIGPSAHAQNTS